MNLSREQKRYRNNLVKKLQSYGTLSTKGAIKYHCGELIGRGLNRDVYVLKHDPDWVVKIQRTTSFDNHIEYMIWQAICFAPSMSKWFAECLTIVETGLVLFQRRVEHKDKKFYPKEVPAFFTDFKTKNYGWVGDQFVCCDYADVLGMMTGLIPKKMRKPRWWIAYHKKPPRRRGIKIYQKL